MPFRSSKIQSRLMNHEDPSDLSTPTKLFNVLQPSTRDPRFSPLISSKAILPSNAGRIWWHPFTPFAEAEAEELRDSAGRTSFAVEEGLLAQEGRDGLGYGDTARLKKRISWWNIIEMVALFAVVVFLVRVAVWAVRSTGRGKGAAYHHHSQDLQHE